MKFLQIFILLCMIALPSHAMFHTWFHDYEEFRVWEEKNCAKNLRCKIQDGCLVSKEFSDSLDMYFELQNFTFPDPLDHLDPFVDKAQESLRIDEKSHTIPFSKFWLSEPSSDPNVIAAAKLVVEKEIASKKKALYETQQQMLRRQATRDRLNAMDNANMLLIKQKAQTVSLQANQVNSMQFRVTDKAKNFDLEVEKETQRFRLEMEYNLLVSKTQELEQSIAYNKQKLIKLPKKVGYKKFVEDIKMSISKDEYSLAENIEQFELLCARIVILHSSIIC